MLASRAQVDLIDLHFHDLRHEGASRLLEAGWPLHHVSGNEHPLPRRRSTVLASSFE